MVYVPQRRCPLGGIYFLAACLDSVFEREEALFWRERKSHFFLMLL